MTGAGLHRSLIPQQRKLDKEESEIDFEIWRESIIFHICLDTKSARFTASGDLKTWNNTENRGFANDEESVAEDKRMNAAAKASLLNIVLSSIAYNAPVISWNFVTQEATSLEDIWNRLRQRYGIKRSGTRITELVDITKDPGESVEALWEKVYSFFQENLLRIGGSVKHQGADNTANEQFSPTLLNTMVVIWLSKIHSSLPAAVRYKFSTQLRSQTIYTSRVEISDAIPVLLEEINEKEAAVKW